MVVFAVIGTPVLITIPLNLFPIITGQIVLAAIQGGAGHRTEGGAGHRTEGGEDVDTVGQVMKRRSRLPA